MSCTKAQEDMNENEQNKGESGENDGRKSTDKNEDSAYNSIKIRKDKKRQEIVVQRKIGVISAGFEAGSYAKIVVDG